MRKHSRIFGGGLEQRVRDLHRERDERDLTDMPNADRSGDNLDRPIQYLGGLAATDIAEAELQYPTPENDIPDAA